MPSMLIAVSVPAKAENEVCERTCVCLRFVIGVLGAPAGTGSGFVDAVVGAEAEERARETEVDSPEEVEEVVLNAKEVDSDAGVGAPKMNGWGCAPDSGPLKASAEAVVIAVGDDDTDALVPNANAEDESPDSRAAAGMFKPPVIPSRELLLELGLLGMRRIGRPLFDRPWVVLAVGAAPIENENGILAEDENEE